MTPSLPPRPRTPAASATRLATPLLAVPLLALLASPAAALNVLYKATVAGIPVGEGRLTGEVGRTAYDVTLAGTSGVAAWTTRFSTQATGTIAGGRVVPARYVSTSQGRTSRTTSIAFVGGEARATIEPPPDAEMNAGRVPLTDAHRRGVVDPLSGLVAQALAGALESDPCSGLTRGFSGWARFDVALRPGSAAADGSLTCRVAYQPIAGHRPAAETRPSGQAITVSFRANAAEGLRLPERIEVPLTIGSLVIQRAE